MFSIIDNHVFQDGNNENWFRSSLIVFETEWLSIKD